MQMRCPCVSFDDPAQLTQVCLPQSHPSVHERLYVSSTPLIASPHTRFCALARVACIEESCNVPSGDLALGMVALLQVGKTVGCRFQEGLHGPG